MPIYEYECKSCQTRFERMQRFSEPPVAECPECGGAVRKVLQPVGIVFKGSGWYKTDSRPADGAATPAKDGAGKDGKADAAAKPAEAKPADAASGQQAPAPASSPASTSSTPSASGAA